MERPPAAELLVACRVLFGREPDPAFLGRLHEGGLRAAWRARALETHPDRVCGHAAKRASAERFIEATRAYGLLREYVESRGTRRQAQPPGSPRPAAAPRAHRPPATPRQPSRGCGHQPRAGRFRRRMRFGEYLLHAGVISFTTLVEAIVWQRRQRERFCQVGRRWGYLSASDVDLLFAKRRPHEPVGAAAERLCLLSAFQVRTVLCFQRSRQRPIGGYFVERGVLTPASLGRLLLSFERHNASRGRR